MGMDKTNVCRKALQLFCNSEYKQGTAEGRACDLWWADAVRQGCARYGWSFTRREVVLVGRLCEDGAQFREFVLPDDCIRVVRVCAPGRLEELEVEMMVGRRMLLPRAAGERVCVFYQSDLSVFEGCLPQERAFFCKGVVCLLASMVCGVVDVSYAGLRQGFEEAAERAFQQEIFADAAQVRRVRKVMKVGR